MSMTSCLLHTDPNQLQACEQAIETFLADVLMLALKPERRLRPVNDGADFLGYIVRPYYRLVRRRVIGHLRDRLAAFEQAQVTAESRRLPAQARDQLRAVLASYLGHFAHADAQRLVGSLFETYPWLNVLFALDAASTGRIDGGFWRPRPRWQPPGVTSLRSQVTYFRQAFAPSLVLVQLGNRVALFERDLRVALEAAPWIGRWSQSAPEIRQGLGESRSWPLSHLKGLGKSLRKADAPSVFVAEEGLLPGGMKRRVLRYLFVGASGSLLAKSVPS